MKNKTNLAVIGIAFFIYIFELRILGQLNITSDQYFIMNKYYTESGHETTVIDLTFIFLLVILLLNIFPSKMINKINSTLVNSILWISALFVFIFETGARPDGVNGSIDVNITNIVYQQSYNDYITNINSLFYFLVLMFIINIFLLIRTRNKFIGVNFVLFIVTWLSYYNEYSKFPTVYVGDIKANPFRTLFDGEINVSIIHYTIFIIIFAIFINILVLVNKYMLIAQNKRNKRKEDNVTEVITIGDNVE